MLLLFLLNTFLGNVYTTPEKFANAVLFLPLGLPSTLIRRKRNFSKALFKPEEPAFRFRVDVKHFDNGAFEYNGVTIIM